MKTNSLFPIIVVEDLDASIAFYTEVLGFHLKHCFKNKMLAVVINDADYELESKQKKCQSIKKYWLTFGVFSDIMEPVQESNNLNR